MTRTPARRPLAATLRLAALVVGVAGLAPAAPAQAQSVYRTVLPDGRVVYGDHPAAASATVLHKPASEKPVLLAPAPPPTPPAAAAPPAATKRSAAEIAATPLPASALPEPKRLAALMAVLGAEDLANRAGEVCEGIPAAQATQATTAIQSWRLRNGQYLNQAHRMLQIGVSSEARPVVAARAEVAADQSVGGALTAPPGARATWCQRFVAELEAGKQDVKSHVDWMDPLMGWHR